MLDYLKQLMDFIAMIAQFLLNTIQGIFEMITLIPSFYTTISTINLSMPGVLQAFIVLGLSLSVLFVIIGRV